MTTYRVNVYREDRWWMIDVPELDGHRGADGLINVGSLTQARHYADIEQEARDFICTVVDAAPSAVDLDVHIDVDGLDVGDAAAAIAADRATAKEAEARAISRSTEVAQRLSAAGVPMREIAEIVGVTHQRVDQLINKTSANAVRKVTVTAPRRVTVARDSRTGKIVAAKTAGGKDVKVVSHRGKTNHVTSTKHASAKRRAI